MPIGTNRADTFSYFFFFSPQLSKMLTKLEFPFPHNALAENLGHLGQHVNYFRTLFTVAFELYAALTQPIHQSLRHPFSLCMFWMTDIAQDVRLGLRPGESSE